MQELQELKEQKDEKQNSTSIRRSYGMLENMAEMSENDLDVTSPEKILCAPTTPPETSRRSYGMPKSMSPALTEISENESDVTSPNKLLCAPDTPPETFSCNRRSYGMAENFSKSANISKKNLLSTQCLPLKKILIVQ